MQKPAGARRRSVRQKPLRSRGKSMSALMNEPFAPPPKTDFEVDIDETHAQFFAENGYLALGRVTTDEELAWLSDVYDELLARPMSGFPDTYYDAVRPYG